MTRRKTINFDNRISYADLIAIIGAGAACMWLMFGVTADIEAVEKEQLYLRQDIDELDLEVTTLEDTLSSAIDALREDTKRQLELLDDRSEQRHDKAMNKLDTLIERDFNMLMLNKEPQNATN